MPCRAMPRCVASHRAAPHQARATPRHADVVPIYSLLAFASPPILTAPFAAVEVYWSADGRAGKRTGFPSQPPSQSLSVFLALPRTLPAVSFSPISARPPPRLPFLLSRSPPPPLSLSSSSLKHTFRVFPLSCAFLSLFHPLRRHCPRPRDPDGDALVLVATLVAIHVDYHPSCRFSLPFTHQDERKYLCRCIVSRFLSLSAESRTTGIPAASVTVNRTCCECFIPIRIRIFIWSVINRYPKNCD